MTNWKIKFWQKINAIAMHYIMKSKPDKKKPTDKEIKKEQGNDYRHIKFLLNGEMMNIKLPVYDPEQQNENVMTASVAMAPIDFDKMFNIAASLKNGKQPIAFNDEATEPDKEIYYDIKPDTIRNIANLWLEDDNYYKRAAFDWLNEFIKDEHELILNLVMLMALNDVQGSFTFKNGYKYTKLIENEDLPFQGKIKKVKNVEIEIVVNYKGIYTDNFKQDENYFQNNEITKHICNDLVHSMKNIKIKNGQNFKFVQWPGVNKYLKNTQKVPEKPEKTK